MPSAFGLCKKRAADNPDLHQGRKRKVAHVEGNYATSVFVPIEIVDDEGTVSSASFFSFLK